MSNLYAYRDNILSKIETNKDIEEVLNFLYGYSDDKQVEIRIKDSKGYKNKINMENSTLIHLLNQLKNKNNERIDEYLALSFDENFWNKKKGDS